MVRQWLALQRWGLVIGLSLTAAAVVLHLEGLTERIELLGFDFHVRHFSRIPASNEIVHIDIDDDAFERVGSWPWPRDVQAELVRILGELGAGRIVLDIVWTEPMAAQVRLPTLDPYVELEGEIELVGELSEENVVYPDDELAAAISDTGWVYLAMYPYAGKEEDEVSPLEDPIARLLRREFGLSARELAAELGESVEVIEAVLAGVKQQVARERVKAVLDAMPSASAEDVHEAILSTPFDRQTADRTDILAAYHRELCLRALQAKCPPVPEGLRGKLPVVPDITPPLDKLSAAARAVGFVTFKPDRDGRTRHVPLMMEWEGRVIEQLAFAAVRAALDIRLEDLSLDDRGELQIAARGERAPMRVQLDDEGQMLINWHVEPGGWPKCFTHLPVTQFLRIYDCRKQARANAIRRQLSMAEAIRHLVEARQGMARAGEQREAKEILRRSLIDRLMALAKDENGLALYRERCEALREQERTAELGRRQGQGDREEVKKAEAEAARLRRLMGDDERDTTNLVVEAWAQLKQEDANDPEIAEIYRRFEQANKLITQDLAELDRQLQAMRDQPPGQEGEWLINDPEDYQAYCRQYREMLSLEQRARLGRLRGRGDSPEAQEAEVEARRLRGVIETYQQDAVAQINAWAEARTQPGKEPNAAQVSAALEAAKKLLTQDLEGLRQANEVIAVEEQRLIAQLGPLVAGKTCFVGYTATAVADMVTTPAYERMPGVLVHSNTFNDFVQGQFRSWSQPWTQAAIIGLFGVLMTVLTTTRGPKLSFLLVLMVIGVALALNASAVFERMDHWLRLLTALGLTFVVWAMIVLLRYLTTDRQKRYLRKAVAQYVSPAMAEQIAESAARVDLSPVSGEVTCFFSDLQGFTPVSERLGPEGTRTVLNPYLEAMSVALHRHRALINKFMGDGVFAFFNPPILPCAEHEVAACESALDCQRAVREMAARHAEHPLADEFRRLFTRIGIASGRVFVGDYGSESKLDYTCMGDTVNLAARLESANKQFGSAIMLAGSTRDRVGDRYVYRSLGALQVKGQTVGVAVCELLGRPGEVDGDAVRFAEAFGQGVAAFARRDWERSKAVFEQCLALRPNDPGCLRYLSTIQVYAEQPPPDDWSGALELTEK